MILKHKMFSPRDVSANAIGETILHLAVDDSQDAFDYLTEQRNPIPRGHNCYKHDEEFARLILKQNEKLNSEYLTKTNVNGDTVLHLAYRVGCSSPITCICANVVGLLLGQSAVTKDQFLFQKNHEEEPGQWFY